MSFSPLDILAARHMGAESDSDRFHLFCYLAGAYRLGKMYVEIADDPSLLFDELPEGFAESIKRAYVDLESEGTGYVKTEGRLYLASSFQMSQNILNHYDRLQKSQLRFSCDIEKAKAFLANEPVTDEQKDAILQALKTPVAFITGGPGTGKTYTAGLFVKTLLSEASLRVVLAAPTGKAAANLAKSIQRALGKSIDTKTLHALLQLRPLAYAAETQALPYDLVIVDESSMVDARLFEKLLASMETGTRLLFLGDVNQLPPVEPGAPFAEYAEGTSCLTTCLRTELQSIITLAKLVSEQKASDAISFLQNASSSSGISLTLMTDAEMEKMVTTQVAYEKVRLLTPMKTGALGTEHINAALFAHFQKKQGKAREVPIMVLKNDYTLDLSNGQMGMATADEAFFETENGVKTIPRILLGSHEVAFCISVHKSQGSEFDEVLLLLPKGSERFGSKMLYTAITRAKSRLTIWSSESVLQDTILRV
jgi:exodeoxyribonuclease V alpha subunit